ncbi:MAG: hypothetical protein LBJ10_11235 [Clostridiales bacterium]|jgi:hypothetical protein|nr:hypothetical protein [Clostridiales bacterium]
MKSAIGLFTAAGVNVSGIADILELGIYITAAVKSPKAGYAADTAAVKARLPILEAELALFPNLKAIGLMGDVAKKAANMIAKVTGKNLLIEPFKRNTIARKFAGWRRRQSEAHPKKPRIRQYARFDVLRRNATARGKGGTNSGTALSAPSQDPTDTEIRQTSNLLTSS